MGLSVRVTDKQYGLQSHESSADAVASAGLLSKMAIQLEHLQQEQQKLTQEQQKLTQEQQKLTLQIQKLTQKSGITVGGQPAELGGYTIMVTTGGEDDKCVSSKEAVWMRRSTQERWKNKLKNFGNSGIEEKCPEGRSCCCLTAHNSLNAIVVCPDGVSDKSCRTGHDIGNYDCALADKILPGVEVSQTPVLMWDQLARLIIEMPTWNDFRASVKMNAFKQVSTNGPVGSQCDPMFVFRDYDMPQWSWKNHGQTKPPRNSDSQCADDLFCKAKGDYEWRSNDGRCTAPPSEVSEAGEVCDFKNVGWDCADNLMCNGVLNTDGGIDMGTQEGHKCEKIIDNCCRISEQ